jgi:hypothetical protein
MSFGKELGKIWAKAKEKAHSAGRALGESWEQVSEDASNAWHKGKAWIHTMTKSEATPTVEPTSTPEATPTPESTPTPTPKVVLVDADLLPTAEEPIIVAGATATPHPDEHSEL